MKNEKGYIEGEIISIILVFGVFSFFTWLFLWGLWCIRIETGEQLVSGVVYNNTNNRWPLGNTKFSVRASEDTYVSEENKSSYCLPPNSRYRDIVKKAAQDKSTKVVVKTEKVFTVVGNPFVCVDNVKVEFKKVMDGRNGRRKTDPKLTEKRKKLYEELRALKGVSKWRGGMITV